MQMQMLLMMQTMVAGSNNLNPDANKAGADTHANSDAVDDADEGVWFQ